MSLERVIDHTEQGLGLLITQYRGKPLLKAWASAYLRQVQLLEDAIFDVLIKRMLDKAVGEQLRVIGRIVGEEPNDNDDATFKIMINARIRINRSRGNTDDVLAVLALISATPVLFKEYRNACLFLGSLVIPDRDPVLIYSKLHETKAAGVKLTYVVPTTNTKSATPRSVGAIVTANDPTHAAGSSTSLKAVSTSTATQPFALTDGMTLGITIDNLTTFAASIVFHSADFAAIGAATAAEVIAAIRKQLAWNFPGDLDVYLGSVRVTSRRRGAAGSRVAITGTANAIFGFPTPTVGTGDVSNGLAADVVTIRQPLVEPLVIPGAPIVAYVDPGDVQELP
jgi:hypothetical protein